MGAAYLEAAMPAEAIEPLQRSVDYWRAQPAGAKTRLPEDLLLLAVAKMETDAADEAVALANEAIDLRLDAAPALLAEARFTLAEAHLAQGQPALAVETARAALQELARDPNGDEGLKADINAWLAER
jgi:hypothetical protein